AKLTSSACAGDAAGMARSIAAAIPAIRRRMGSRLLLRLRMFRRDIAEGHGEADGTPRAVISVARRARDAIARAIEARNGRAVGGDHLPMFVDHRPAVGIEHTGRKDDGVVWPLVLERIHHGV